MTARKPTHLRLLSGTARRDREPPATPPLPPVGEIAPPAWLRDLNALAEWHRLAPALMANRLLHMGNISMFAQLCALHGHLVAAWGSGTPPSAAMLGQYRKALGDLTAGAPIRSRSGTPANNRFANNGRSR